MATGVFFVFALAHASEGAAASAAFLGLLTTAALSPAVGRLVDSGWLDPRRAGGAYCLSGCLMGLLLPAGVQPWAIYANVVAATALALPSHLQLTRAASAALPGRPGTGFGLFACASAAGTLAGALSGAILVSRAAWIPVWVSLKAFGSVGVGLTLAAVVPGTFPGPSRSIPAGGRPGTGRPWTSFPRSLKGLGLGIATFSLARALVLLCVNFKLFRAFGGSVVPYSVACNLAAATAFAAFPGLGRTCDAVGSPRFLSAGLLLSAPYLALLSFVGERPALTVLWLLPMNAVVEVGQLAAASAAVPHGEKAAAIGFVTAASSLGTLIGTWLVARWQGGFSAFTLAAVGTLVPLVAVGILRLGGLPSGEPSASPGE